MMVFTYYGFNSAVSETFFFFLSFLFHFSEIFCTILLTERPKGAGGRGVVEECVQHLCFINIYMRKKTRHDLRS